MKVGVEGITYGGNHGLEIQHPDGTRFNHPMPPGYVAKPPPEIHNNKINNSPAYISKLICVIRVLP